MDVFIWAVSEKRCLNIFVVVIPKEGLTGGAQPILILVWHRLQNIIYEGSSIQFYSWCCTQRRIGGCPPANPSLGTTTTKIVRHIFSWHSSYIVAYHLYKGSCFRWLEDIWRAYAKSGLNNCKSFPLHNHSRYPTELLLRVGRSNIFRKEEISSV